MIFIRADANENIGTGHVMRCLAIAAQIKKLNNTVKFVIADDRSKDMIEERGYSAICLNSQWNDLNQEIETMKNLLSTENNKVLVDSYFVTEKYLMTLSSVATTYYIDDLYSMHYPVDVLINYNIYGPELDYKEKYNSTKLLLGTAYSPLRKEFIDIPKRKFKGVKNVLITSGGTDNYDVLGNVLAMFLSKDNFRDVGYYCVLGRFNINIDSIKKRFKGFQNVHFLQNINNIDYYMQKCDVAITAGGTTTYELCACGIPSVLYSIADNQLGIAYSFSRKGIIPWVGDVRNDMPGCLVNIEKEVERLQDGTLWEYRSRKMQQLVDGNGAIRIAKEILK